MAPTLRFVLCSVRALAIPAALLLVAGAAFASDVSQKHVRDARRLLRARDIPAAQSLLAKAMTADATDSEAQVLFQDVARDDGAGESLLADYRAKAAAHPDDPFAQYLYARLLKPDAAVYEFEKLALRFVSSPWPHEGRAAAYHALGRDADAAAEHDKAVVAAPGDPRFRVSLARSFEKAGQWQSAADAWKMASDAKKNEPAYVLGYGEALRRAGRTEEAIAAFQAASKLDLTEPEPQFRIGLALADAGKRDEALAAFDLAIALEKPWDEPYVAAVRTSVARGRAAADSEKRELVAKDLDRALGYANAAVAADVRSAAAHIALANVREVLAEIDLTHADSAVQSYDVALALLPGPTANRVRALTGKAYVLLLQGKWADAQTTAQLAIDQDERETTALLHAGRAICALGKQEEAIRKYYNPALKIVPGDALLHHARGLAYWELAKLTDARKDLEAAVAADTRNARIALSLGELYYQLKMYKQGQTILVATCDMRPSDPEAWRALGRTLTGLKSWEDAATAYEKVVELVEGAAVPAGSAPAEPPTQPPGQPPGGTPPPPAVPPGTPPATAPEGTPPATAPKPEFATQDHLYLALLYSDKMMQKEKAREHAKKFVDQGGTNPNLDQWLQDLISGK